MFWVYHGLAQCDVCVWIVDECGVGMENKERERGFTSWDQFITSNQYMVYGQSLERLSVRDWKSIESFAGGLLSS
jgi:hypothetical protein